MKPDTKRRILIFGTGLMIGCVLSLGLFSYAEKTRAPAQIEKIVIAVSKCDLKAGDKLETKCVEQRDIDSKLTPPDVLLFKNVPLFEAHALKVDVPIGHAFREVDLK